MPIINIFICSKVSTFIWLRQDNTSIRTPDMVVDQVTHHVRKACLLDGRASRQEATQVRRDYGSNILHHCCTCIGIAYILESRMALQ